MSKLENKNSTILLGYQLRDDRFKPLLQEVRKEQRAWKSPSFLGRLIKEPSLLFLEDNLVIDERTCLLELEEHKRYSPESKVLAEKFEFVLNNSKNVEFIDFHESVQKNDVDYIIDVIRSCDNDDFRNSINPLESVYGDYATPNNYEFERVNAGVMKWLNKKYSSVGILDDLLRSPLMEYLNVNNKEIEINTTKELLKDLVDEIASHEIPTPLVTRDYNPEELVSKLNSTEAIKLRKYTKQLTSENIETKILELKELSEYLSEGNGIKSTLANFGVSLGKNIPLLLFPEKWILFSWNIPELFNRTKELIEESERELYKSKYQWLELVNYIAEVYRTPQNPNVIIDL